jgi:oxygen-independent coproporphyrinogen-3 oxidase
MAGIYIHIPYCRKACSYCDFYFSTNTDSKSDFLNALHKEIVLQKNFIPGQIETIYFGGGTPSLLSANEIKAILELIHSTYTVSNTTEITLEANPDDLNEAYLSNLLKAGVNRLSIGLQTFDNTELNELNRLHSAEKNTQVVQLAKAAGFKNITIDLIYGSPWLSHEQWKKNIEHVIALDVPHISCYQLTIEEKTLLHHRIKKGEIKGPDEDKIAEQFHVLIQSLNAAGYEHYEVSNFAKPGFYSRHNTSYWKDVPYFGFGPSAHAYDGKNRYMNIANLHQYIKKINNGETWFTTEELTPSTRYNELILTGLRTVFGVSLPKIVEKTDQTHANYFQRKAQKYIDNGQMIKNGYIYTLTEEAFLFADHISADLFIDEL